MKAKERQGYRLVLCCLVIGMILTMMPIGVSAGNDEKGDNTSIRVNQVGYYPDASKIAVISSSASKVFFYVINADTEEVVFGARAQRLGKILRANFSEVSEVGNYYILTSEGMMSPTFRIADDVYQSLTDALVKFFYYQRCGCDMTDIGALSHKACHAWNADVYDKNEEKIGTMDAIGGWHDAGDYGRYMLPQTAAVYQLMAAWAKNPDLFGDESGIPESKNGIADILDECKWELDWMLKMQEKDGGVYPQVHSKDFIQTMMPDEDTHELAVPPVTTEATAKFTAVMAYASFVFKNIDREYSQKCLAAALLSWSFLEAHPEGLLDLVSFTQYSHHGTREEVDLDDIYWAAAELFRATGEQIYLNKFIALHSEIGTQTEIGWGGAGGFGTIAFLETKSALIDEKLRQRIIDDYVSNTVSGPHKLANSLDNPYFNADVNWWWGSNMCIGNDAYQLYSAGEVGARTDFWISGYRQIDYLLGVNVHSTCFVTDFGTIFPQTPLHGPSKASGGRIPGALVGGAYQKEDYYVDDPENYYCNEVSCYYNSALLVTLAYASVCRNDSAEVVPTNLKREDVSELTLAKLWEMIRNGDFYNSSVNTDSNVTDELSDKAENVSGTTENEENTQGCNSAIGYSVPLATFLTFVCFTATLKRKKKEA